MVGFTARSIHLILCSAFFVPIVLCLLHVCICVCTVDMRLYTIKRVVCIYLCTHNALTHALCAPAFIYCPFHVKVSVC